MKTKALAIIAALFSWVTLAGAQGTAFTYQGRLNDGVNPATGLYDINFTVYDAATSGSLVAGPLSKTATAVNNGQFAVTLDFGANAFNGGTRWLELSVRTNGSSPFTTLAPRQALTAAPYAITAGDVTSANVAKLNVPNTAVAAVAHPIVSGGAISSVVVDNGGSGYGTATPASVIANGPGSGAKLTAVISNGVVVAINVTQPGSGYTLAATVSVGAPPPNNSQVFVTSNYFPNVNIFSNAANVYVGSGAGLSGLWKLGGNAGTTPGANFLGTTDNQPLELKVNNLRALRVEPNVKGAPNMIGGSPFNFVASPAAGAVIAGGGATNHEFASHTNSVAADFGTIGGGLDNTIEPDAVDSTIAGGYANSIQTGAFQSSVGGGGANFIGASALGGTVAGGVANQIWSDSISSSIGGGYNNTIQSTSGNSSIGGGVHNTIEFNAPGSLISGGNNNLIQYNSSGSTIGGGSNNTIQVTTAGATIAAGSNNVVQAGASGATIGGGANNIIQSNAWSSAIGGGSNNTVQVNASGAAIAGGVFNSASGPRAAIPGGDHNVAAGAYSFAAGHYAQALHDNCFVWSDSTSTNVASTTNNQFVVGATNGVWLKGTNTNLKVDGQASFPGGIAGWTSINGGLTVYNGYTYLNGGAYIQNLYGYTYLNNGAAIYNGAYISGGANIYGYTTLNGGATIYNSATIYNGTYMYNGAYAYSGLELYNYGSTGWQLYLSQNSAGKPGGGSWGATSDARLKKNIQPLTGALDKLTQLRGVTFDWINPSDHADETNRQTGFIAQDVEKVFPDWVSPVSAGEHDKALTADGKVRSLSLPFGYDALVVESIKELRAENVELKARVEKLEGLVNALVHKTD